jgi:hypothetical protein
MGYGKIEQDGPMTAEDAYLVEWLTMGYVEVGYPEEMRFEADDYEATKEALHRILATWWRAYDVLPDGTIHAEVAWGTLDGIACPTNPEDGTFAVIFNRRYVHHQIKGKPLADYDREWEA